MKKLTRNLIWLVVPALITFVACKKDNNNSTPPPTQSTALQTYISSDTSLSIFNAAVQKTNNSALIAGNDSVTVLVPTNAAFRSAGITESTIGSMSTAAVDSLLRYDIIHGSANLASGSYTPFQTELGTNLYGFGGGVDSNYFNGVQATRVSVSGSKGTVYRLTAPLTLPYSTGNSYLSADTSLSFFDAALTRAGINVPDTGWTTVLSPTNNAFRNAGFATIADINNSDSVTLRNRLMYHILPGQFFSNSYSGLTTVNTSVPNHSITIGTGAAGPSFTGSASGSTPFNFAGMNVLAGNNTIYQPIGGFLAP